MDLKQIELKTVVAKRLFGFITELEFKHLRLLNGLYLQLHSHMMRIGVVNGVLGGAQLALLFLICERHDKGFFHVTTRQNVQLNWITLQAVFKIVGVLYKFGLYCSHTAGNVIRHVVVDPLTGICLDEAQSCASYALCVLKLLCLNMRLFDLPRKIKICIHSALHDRVLSRFTDVGIELLSNNKCIIKLGGGLGRQPRASTTWIKTNLNVLPNCVLAFVKVYCVLSKTEKYCSRTKSLLSKLNTNKFTNLLLRARTPMCACVSVFTSFTNLLFYRACAYINWRLGPFVDWYGATYSHKLFGFRSLEFACANRASLPGDVYPDKVLVMATQLSLDELRLSLDQTFVLPYLHISLALVMFVKLASFKLCHVVCCPGADYCSLASARSGFIAQKIALLNLSFKVRVSGCVNACSQHHLGDVGVIGLTKRNVEHYQIIAGGSLNSFCKPITRALPAYRISPILLKLNQMYECLKKDVFEQFSACFARNDFMFSK